MAESRKPSLFHHRHHLRKLGDESEAIIQSNKTHVSDFKMIEANMAHGTKDAGGFCL